MHDPYAVCPGDPPAPPAPALRYCVGTLCMITAPPSTAAAQSAAPPPAQHGRPPGHRADAHGCVLNYTANVDYFQRAPRPRGLRCRRRVRRSDAGADHDLVPQELQGAHQPAQLAQVPPPQCGTPAVHNDPSGITVDSSGVPSVPVFTVPVQSWSTGGTIPISFVEEIDMLPSAGRWTPRT